MKDKKYRIHIISRELFQFSLVTYLILLLLETFQQGFVSYFFNLNIILGVVFVSGIAMVLTKADELETRSLTKRKAKKHIFWGICFALFAAFLVFYKTFEIGDAAFLITFLAAAIVVTFSLFSH